MSRLHAAYVAVGLLVVPAACDREPTRVNGLGPGEVPDVTVAATSDTSGAEVVASAATPRPAYAKWTADDVKRIMTIAFPMKMRFRNLDLFDPAQKQRSESSLRVLVPALGEDQGGRIFTFNSAEDLASMTKYYERLGKASPNLVSRLIAQDNVLVQMNGSLSDNDTASITKALTWLGREVEFSALVGGHTK